MREKQGAQVSLHTATPCVGATNAVGRICPCALIKKVYRYLDRVVYGPTLNEVECACSGLGALSCRCCTPCIDPCINLLRSMWGTSETVNGPNPGKPRPLLASLPRGHSSSSCSIAAAMPSSCGGMICDMLTRLVKCSLCEKACQQAGIAYL